MGITEGSKRSREFSAKIGDSPKGERTVLENFLQSNLSLPSTSSRSSDESFGLNNSSGMKSNYNLLSPGVVSPVSFSPASPFAMSAWSNGSACPSPWTLMSPLHSPDLMPFLDGRSYGFIATMVR